MNRLIGREHPGAELLLSEVRVLDPRAGLEEKRMDVRVSGGAIAELGEPGTLTAQPAEELIPGEGRLLLSPAFFDPHVHLRTPGQEHKEDIESGTRAAAAGGFAGVIAMPNTDPVLDSPELLSSLRARAREEAHVPVGFLPAITRGLQGEQLTDMAALNEQGALGFSDDGKPVTSAGLLREALKLQRNCGGVIALHEEDPTLSAGGAMNEGTVSAELGIAGIPTLAESTMVARDAAIAGYEDARVHFQHLSCTASVEAVAQAKAHGWRVSSEVSPHHLLLTDEEVRSLDTRMKMHPPLTTESDRQALIEGLRSGVIDCIATDHAPHSRAEKDVPFEQAANGTTGLETAFAALYTGLVLPSVIELAMLIERMSAGGALFGVPAPRITVGERANLALIDLDAVWIAGEHGWESRSDNCCFAGRRLQGRVLLTLAAGGIAHRDEALAMVGA
jgi:dihydroorotase